jgi:hypothetical protein
VALRHHRPKSFESLENGRPMQLPLNSYSAGDTEVHPRRERRKRNGNCLCSCHWKRNDSCLCSCQKKQLPGDKIGKSKLQLKSKLHLKSVLAKDKSERGRFHYKSPHLMWWPCNVLRNRTAHLLCFILYRKSKIQAVLKHPILDSHARMANIQIRRPCEGRLSRTSVPR